MIRKSSNITPLRQTYQIKITLEQVKPPVWRRILVDSRISLDALHIAIQVSMGWLDCHLHQFIDQNNRIFTTQQMDDDFIIDIDSNTIDESAVLLNDILKNEKDWLRYDYDFGDGWSHKILLEKILPYKQSQNSVVCIKGKRACPPEDCGGPPGYAELLEQLESAGTDEQDREDILEWLGDDFDAEFFDIEVVNDELDDFFKAEMFNQKSGLGSQLFNNDDVINSDTLFPDLDQSMLEQGKPGEIKDLIGGLDNAVLILNEMSEMLEIACEGFEQIVHISKDKKVTALAKKMLKILDS